MTLSMNKKSRASIQSSQIVMLRGDANYTIFYMSNGKKITNPHTLKLFEKTLATEGFLRVHRAYLVNPNFMSSYNKMNKSILMKNGMTIEVARRRQKVLQGTQLDWTSPI